jgi:hypothetical protein
MINFSEINLRDEAEMRAFYASFGISQRTTEAAIKAARRDSTPVEKETKPSPIKGKKRKGSKGKFYNSLK